MRAKRFPHIMTLLAAILVSAACNYRDITMETTPVVHFRVDWSDFAGEEEPTGMSIYCYSKDGGMPYVFKSNEIHLIESELPPGTYDIIVFNQVEAEFSTLSFSGMDSFETARIDLLRKEKASWVSGSDPVVSEPEWLAVGTLRDCVIPKYVEPEERDLYIDLKPLNVVYTAHIAFKIYRINKIFRSFGDFGGLAGGLMLGTGKKLESTATQMMSDFHIDYDEEIYDRGVLKTSFLCLGIPSEEGVDRKPEDNRVHFRFFLVDEHTYCNFTFMAGERIEISEADKTINLELGLKGNGPQDPGDNADPDRPGQLPDVEPAKIESGFDATVGNWGEEIIIDLKAN